MNVNDMMKDELTCVIEQADALEKENVENIYKKEQLEIEMEKNCKRFEDATLEFKMKEKNNEMKNKISKDVNEKLQKDKELLKNTSDTLSIKIEKLKAEKDILVQVKSEETSKHDNFVAKNDNERSQIVEEIYRLLK